MGTVHADAYQRMADVQVAAVVDTDETSAKILGEKLGVPYYSSIDEAFGAASGVDIIDICLPTDQHVQAVKKAADGGIAVICEKPLARTLKEAEAVISYCKEKKVPLFVGHVLRFFHEYTHIKQQLDDDEIGKAGVVRTFRGGAFPVGKDNWYSDNQKSGGLLLDMVVHDFDFLRWCFGEVDRVYARGLYERVGQGIDYALVTLRFASGVIAHVEGSWAHEGFSTAIEIAGKKGIIDYNASKDQALVFQPRTTVETKAQVEVPASAVKDTPYYLELRHFIDCMKENTEPKVTADDAYKAMEIALAAIESTKTKQPVWLGKRGDRV